MSSISSLTSGNSAVTGAITKASKELGKDEFLKLLLTELRYQDAQDPVKDKEFIAQMAQFSALEQTTNLVNAFEKMASKSNRTEALNILGTVVTATKSSTGEAITGLVQSIKYTDGEPELTLLREDGGVHVVTLGEVNQVSMVSYGS